MTNLLTSSTDNDVIKYLFSIASLIVLTIIFQTWGSKLLYLVWFRSYGVYKIVKTISYAIKIKYYMTSSSVDDVVKLVITKL